MSAYLLDSTVTSLIQGAPQTFSVQCIAHGAAQEELIAELERRLVERFSDPEWTAEIEKTVSIPVFDQMASETGLRPLDLAAISSVEEAASYEDAGLWENCHELVPVGVSFADVQAFQASMAADAASALNWDPARQLYFLIYAYGEAEDASEDMAVIAQARNAPAAAWAWRYHARDIKSVKQPIRVEGLCPIMGAPKPANESKE